jgi:ferric-dicitrate binding protein FerR (iron transport regulator)
MAPEAEPPAEVRERIRRAVAAEWRATVLPAPIPATPVRAASRGQWTALAAGVAVAAITLGIYQSGTRTPAPVVATLTRLSGPVEVGAEGGWQPVNPGQTLSVGQQLVTGMQGRAALALPRGVSLRLDADTRVALAGSDRVVVERGAVYLDAGIRPAAGQSVRLESRFGTTRHLGTQYEVRVTPEQMLVSVREGQVALEAAGAATTRAPGNSQFRIVAEAGEQLAVKSTGAVARGTVGGQDARWDWITEVAPPFAIEDRRLSEFLVWVCRETGRKLAFSSPQVEAAAEGIILRGSVAGLSPDAALAAVMATTNLAYTDDNGRLLIQPTGRQAATR